MAEAGRTSQGTSDLVSADGSHSPAYRLETQRDQRHREATWQTMKACQARVLDKRQSALVVKPTDRSIGQSTRIRGPVRHFSENPAS